MNLDYWKQYDKKLNSIAKECAESLSESEKDLFKMHMNYWHYHFTYGLYLRNKYIEQFDCKSDNFRGCLGEQIMLHMIPILFPEFGNNLNLVSKVFDNEEFAKLNAQYNLKYKRNICADFSLEQWLELPEFTINDETTDEEIDVYIETEKEKMDLLLRAVEAKLCDNEKD